MILLIDSDDGELEVCFVCLEPMTKRTPFDLTAECRNPLCGRDEGGSD